MIATPLKAKKSKRELRKEILDTIPVDAIIGLMDEVSIGYCKMRIREAALMGNFDDLLIHVPMMKILAKA